MTIKDPFPKQEVFIERDAIDEYFECIMACSVDNRGMQCITQYVEFYLENEVR